MDSEEYKGSGCCVEERPDGLYVVRGDKAQWPYGSVLLPETERHRIAEELGVTERK